MVVRHDRNLKFPEIDESTSQGSAHQVFVSCVVCCSCCLKKSIIYVVRIVADGVAHGVSFALSRRAYVQGARLLIILYSTLSLALPLSLHTHTISFRSALAEEEINWFGVSRFIFLFFLLAFFFLLSFLLVPLSL